MKSEDQQPLSSPSGRNGDCETPSPMYRETAGLCMSTVRVVLAEPGRPPFIHSPSCCCSSENAHSHREQKASHGMNLRVQGSATQTRRLPMCTKANARHSVQGSQTQTSSCQSRPTSLKVTDTWLQAATGQAVTSGEGRVLNSAFFLSKRVRVCMRGGGGTGHARR